MYTVRYSYGYDDDDSEYYDDDAAAEQQKQAPSHSVCTPEGTPEQLGERQSRQGGVPKAVSQMAE